MVEEHQQQQPAPPTASSVANSFFHNELEAHHGPDSTLPTDTIVILHDAVYGHRFSRPRTSRSALSTIVERPERIKAAVLGVSMAYVRLGERHCDGAFPAHPRTNIHQLPNIPFRIRKSSTRIPLTSPAVTNVHGIRWMEELKLMCESAETKLAMGGRELQRPEMQRTTPAEKLHEGDLYLCSESLDAMEGALGAVCDAIDVVFSPSPAPRRAFVGVRPPGHHCSASHPSGFCWVNNVLVGMMHASLVHNLTHAAIIDFDLHHGDGSQAVVWQHNARAAAARKYAPAWEKTTIGYFSLHDINSYPCEMGDPDKVKNASLCIDNAHGQSIWNVHLQPWKTEKEFWDIYESKYSAILVKTRSYLQAQADSLRANNQEPKAAIFFSAGFDASEWESAGMQRHQVNVPTEFYARLSEDVVKLADEAGLAVDGRVISVLEGGYSDRALFSGVFSHLTGLSGGQPVKNEPISEPGLAYEMGQKLGTISEPEAELSLAQQENGVLPRPYNPEWWSSSQLDSIEHLWTNIPSPPRKPRTNAPPTYFSPTQASNAKVIDPAKVRRSLSGLSSTVQRPRPQSPTTPDVPWTVAAHELSKLLIPSDRQTDSCKPEDLNAEATRARRDRQSTLLGIPPTPTAPDRPTSRMSLRERKPKIMDSIEGGDGTADFKKYATPRRRSRSRQGMGKGSESGRTTPTTELPYRRRSSRRLSSGTPGPSSPIKDDNVPVPPLPPEYEYAANRPATANGSRADSSQSNQTQDSGKLNVKKIRQRSATPKGITPKTPQNPRKATPSRQAKTAVKARQKSATVSPTMPASEPSAAPVNKMASGTKKIKINLITQAQKEARERAKSEEAFKTQEEIVAASDAASSISAPAEAEKTTQTPRLAPVHTTTIETSPLQLDPAGSNFLSRAAESGLSTPNDMTLSDIASPLEKKGNTASLSNTLGAHADGEPTVSAGQPDVFITYQPEGPEPEPINGPCEEPLKWLPPNIPTPSANTPVATPNPKTRNPKNGNGLFHYTSGIPFAPRAKADETNSPRKGKTSPVKQKSEKLEKSVWEVPEAPGK